MERTDSKALARMLRGVSDKGTPVDQAADRIEELEAALEGCRWDPVPVRQKRRSARRKS